MGLWERHRQNLLIYLLGQICVEAGYPVSWSNEIQCLLQLQGIKHSVLRPIRNIALADERIQDNIKRKLLNSIGRCGYMWCMSTSIDQMFITLSNTENIAATSS